MITLHCNCKDSRGGRCGVPVATIQNGVVVLQFHHYGQPHTYYLPLADLQRLIETDKERREPALRVT